MRELVRQQPRGGPGERGIGRPGLVLQRERHREARHQSAHGGERVGPQHAGERGDDRAGLLGELLGRLAAEEDRAGAWRPRRSWGCRGSSPTASRSSRPRRTRGRSPSARSARQWVVARPCRLRLETRTPLAITSLRRGTVIRMSNDALSRGWSLAGNHQAAMCGSFMATTSFALASQLLWPWERSAAGTPAYLTETRNWAPLASGAAGVIRSSWSPVWRNSARSTVHGHRADRQQEVEVEARQVLGGAHVQPGPAGEPARAERVAVADVVVQHVDAAVAVLRGSRGRRSRTAPGAAARPGQPPGTPVSSSASNETASSHEGRQRAGRGRSREATYPRPAYSVAAPRRRPSPWARCPGTARCSTRGGATVTTTVLGLPADRPSLTSWSTSSDVSRRLHAAPRPSDRASLTTSSPTPTAPALRRTT